jgi:hypothetical protein
MPERLIGSAGSHEDDDDEEVEGGDDDDDEEDLEGYALAVTARSRRPSSYPL